MSELLILEGEPMVGRILEHKLRREGHAVTWLRAPGGATPETDIALVEVDLGGDSRAWMGSGGPPGSGGSPSATTTTRRRRSGRCAPVRRG